jgi:molybdate transport system substrate-binding protein
MGRRGPALAVALVAAAIGGCGLLDTDGPAAGQLTIFAAASLRDAMTAAATRFEAATGVTVTTAFDSTTTLRVQIEQGAPADLLAAADMQNPQRLVDGGLGSGPVRPFAANRLVIVVPSDDRGPVEDPGDLAGPGVRIVAAGEGVPITAYAERAIGRLADLSGEPEAFVAAVGANTVSREDNVRAVLAKVELGEADAAFVYATDALASDAVRAIELPQAAQVVAHYGAVVVEGSPRAAQAAVFIDWLVGPDGQALLAEHGFVSPAAP